MSAAIPALPFAFVAKIVAANDKGTELSALLTGAVELANQEAGTVVWFAARSDEHTFWIFDAFPTEADREAHANGAIVAALGANSHLLAANPEITPVEVLAAKLP